MLGSALTRPSLSVSGGLLTRDHRAVWSQTPLVSTARRLGPEMGTDWCASSLRLPLGAVASRWPSLQLTRVVGRFRASVLGAFSWRRPSFLSTVGGQGTLPRAGPSGCWRSWECGSVDSRAGTRCRQWYPSPLASLGRGVLLLVVGLEDCMESRCGSGSAVRPSRSSSHFLCSPAYACSPSLCYVGGQSGVPFSPPIFTE